MAKPDKIIVLTLGTASYNMYSHFPGIVITTRYCGPRDTQFQRVPMTQEDLVRAPEVPAIVATTANTQKLGICRRFWLVALLYRRALRGPLHRHRF